MQKPGVVAKKMGVSVGTIRNWFKKGLINGIKLPSGQIRIADQSDVGSSGTDNRTETPTVQKEG